MEKQFLIIDGYNVLHTCGLAGRRAGRGSLQRARKALIVFLRRYLSEPQRNRTTVVFDSQETQLPSVVIDAELLIEFANNHASADDRIIELIRRHSAPKQLLVVSSDHCIQRAAAAKHSVSMDSDVWMDQLLETHAREPDQSRRSEANSAGSGIDVQYWLEMLELNDETEIPTLDGMEKESPSPGKRREVDGLEIFPPGYADDLFDDDQDVT